MIFLRSMRFTIGLLACCLATPLAAQAPVPGLYDRPVLALDPGMHSAPIIRADVDTGGEIAVTGSHDKTVRVWSLADGRLRRTIRMPTGPGDVGKIFAVAISPDGGSIAAGGWTRPNDQQEQIYLFDAATGEMTGRLDGLPNVVNHLAFSPDGSRLAAMLGGGNGLRLYEKTAGEGWRELARDTEYLGSSYGAGFSADSARLATTSEDGRLRLYDRDGALLRAVETDIPDPFGFAINPVDGRIAIGFNDSPALRLHDGETLDELPGPDLLGIDNGDLSKVAWSADGQTLFAGGKYQRDGIVSMLAWPGGGTGPRREIPAGRNTLMSLKPLPKGGVLAAAGDPWLGLFGADDTPLWTRAARQMDPRGQRSSLGLSDDGMVVDFGFEEWGARPARFDVAALKLLADPPADGSTTPPRQAGLAIEDWEDRYAPTLDGTKLPLDAYEMSRSLAIHPEGDRFLLGTEWYLRAFDAAGEELWRKPVPSVVWAVNISGDGRLAVAAYGDGTLRWHRMQDGAELLALFPWPDGKNWIAWEPDGLFASSLGARRALKWYVNRGWDQAPLEIAAGRISESFNPEVIRRVLPQMGTMQAVYAALMAKRSGEFQKLFGGIAPGARLHLLSVGIGEYRNAADRLRLDWADADAADIHAALTGQSDWPYQEGYQVLLRQEEATRFNIRKQLGNLRDRMALAPDSRDLAVIHFSGHGVVRGSPGFEEFYLLPHDVDVATTTHIQDTALPGVELQRQIAAMATYGRVLVLLDTCSSGAALGDGDLGVGAALLRRTLGGRNVTVLASSAGSEVSRETDLWRNGAFTEVVLEALGKDGDGDGNGMISVDELAGYVTRRLPVLTDQNQTPSIETRFGGDLFISGL